MQLIISLLNFAFTMVLSLIAFTYAAVEFPATMKDLLASVKHVSDRISSLVLPEDTMVWVDIFLWPNLIVFAGFVIAVQFAKELLRKVFNGGGRDPASASTQPKEEEKQKEESS